MKQIKTRNIRLLAPAVLLLIASASCSDDMQPGLSGESVPVQVSAGLDGGIRETRAVTTVTSGSMGVFVGNANGYTPTYNLQYTYTDGWKASEPVYVGDANMSMCAYYPYGAATFAANSTTATLTAQQYDATKDMYYATTGGSAVCKATPQASFTMTRAYSRLTFSLSRNDYYPLACKVTKIVMVPADGATFTTTATIDIATGTVTGSSTAANYTIDTSALTVGSSGIAQGATDTSVDLLFPPQTCSGLKLTFTVDGKDLSVTIPADKFTGFTAGSRYTVQVAISGAGVSAVTIPDSWTGNDIKDGSDPYIPVP